MNLFLFLTFMRSNHNLNSLFHLFHFLFLLLYYYAIIIIICIILNHYFYY